jgi:hypothetical protein
LRARAGTSAGGRSTKDTSVVWLWLAGGATHIETFDPKPEAPSEYRSTVGTVDTSIPGFPIGGLFPEIARVANRMAFVHSFSHSSASHLQATHYMMTGTDHLAADSGASPIKPSLGSIAAKARGAYDSRTGLPTFAAFDPIYADGPDLLGPGNAPFYVSGQARNNMNPAVRVDRLDDRRALLKALDRTDRAIDRSGLMDGLDSFESQAFDLVLGSAKRAFDLDGEDPRVRDRYRACGHPLGEKLLAARRLCEAGCGFVTLAYANSYQAWDMHNDLVPQLRSACPPLDRAVACFLEDVHQRGLSEKILLVLSGEFGRTPMVNGVAGRDHWAPLSTLALAGGGLRMGQIVGQSSPKAEVPNTTPIRPEDLMATIFHVLGVDPELQVQDRSGRPTYLLPSGSMPIRELI